MTSALLHLHCGAASVFLGIGVDALAARLSEPPPPLVLCIGGREVVRGGSGGAGHGMGRAARRGEGLPKTSKFQTEGTRRKSDSKLRRSSS